MIKKIKRLKFKEDLIANHQMMILPKNKPTNCLNKFKRELNKVMDLLFEKRKSRKLQKSHTGNNSWKKKT